MSQDACLANRLKRACDFQLMVNKALADQSLETRPNFLKGI
jgi:hypothetical protein